MPGPGHGGNNQGGGGGGNDDPIGGGHLSVDVTLCSADVTELRTIRADIRTLHVRLSQILNRIDGDE